MEELLEKEYNMTEKGIPSDIYPEHLIELYKSPENYGILENATHEATETDSICGDEITIQLLVKDDLIKDTKFSGSGCVLSIVSASLLTKKLIGTKLSETKRLNKEDLLKLINIKPDSSRIKCALLPLRAIQKID
jgi:nitrogen fixation NifU-like protein